MPVTTNERSCTSAPRSNRPNTERDRCSSLYIQLCAFSKAQYRLLSERKEEELFERFYESLVSNAALYAGLLGYTPHFVRDPQTLLPQCTLPLKSKWIIGETEVLARFLINRLSAGENRS